MAGETFVDYYELMQISPRAELETIQRVYRLLAARYHPDNPHTADPEKFVLLRQAYEVLCDAEKRASYDFEREAQMMQPLGVFSLKEFTVGIDGESNRRMGILCLLYNHRRTTPDNPGMSILNLESVMAFPREHLMFTLWYLKDKNYIRQDEQSNFQITAEGVDYVETHLPSNQILYRLLKAAESGDARRATLDDRGSAGESKT